MTQIAEFAYLVNETDRPQPIMHPALRQAGVIGIVPGGLLPVRSNKVEIPPGAACRIPFAVYNQTLTKRACFKRISEAEFLKLAAQAPEFSTTTCAWGLLHPDTEDCDELAAQGSSFCEAHTLKLGGLLEMDKAITEAQAQPAAESDEEAEPAEGEEPAAEPEEPAEDKRGDAEKLADLTIELSKLNLDDLRELAKPLGIDVEGKTKAELREEILAKQA